MNECSACGCMVYERGGRWYGLWVIITQLSESKAMCEEKRRNAYLALHLNL